MWINYENPLFDSYFFIINGNSLMYSGNFGNSLWINYNERTFLNNSKTSFLYFTLYGAILYTIVYYLVLIE